MSDYQNKVECRTCSYWTEDGPSMGTCAFFRAMPLRSQVSLVSPDEYPAPVTLPFRTRRDFGCVAHLTRR